VQGLLGLYFARQRRFVLAPRIYWSRLLFKLDTFFCSLPSQALWLSGYWPGWESSLLTGSTR
jgi:hypothetical protein